MTWWSLCGVLHKVPNMRIRAWGCKPVRNNLRQYTFMKILSLYYRVVRPTVVFTIRGNHNTSAHRLSGNTHWYCNQRSILGTFIALSAIGAIDRPQWLEQVRLVDLCSQKSPPAGMDDCKVRFQKRPLGLGCGISCVYEGTFNILDWIQSKSLPYDLGLVYINDSFAFRSIQERSSSTVHMGDKPVLCSVRCARCILPITASYVVHYIDN